MWFGGSFGSALARRRPDVSRLIWPAVSTIWDSGDWPEQEKRVVQHGSRRLVVFGPCAAPQGELAAIAASGVPDDVAWRWSGSYTVVQFDSLGTSIWTDLGWSWPVYTYANDGATMWASSSLLLASLNDHRLDLGQVTDRLIDADLSEAVSERSWFREVRRVPPGHRITCTTGGAMESRPVWTPRQEYGIDHPAKLRAELETAVRLRVDGSRTPSTDLSGGFDSTALGLIAARHLLPQRRRIIGATVHPAGITSGGDADYAREAGRHPGIRHVWLPLTGAHAPYQALNRIPATDEPAPSTVSHAYLSAELRWLAREHGCDLHMTGDGGDGLLLTRPEHLADLLAEGRVVQAIRETALWAHVRKKSWKDVYPTARGAAECPSGRPWLIGSGSGRSSPVAGLFAPQTRSQRAVIAAMAPVGRTARSDAQIAEQCGITLHNPYVDSRIIDTCLAVPTQELPGPARYKPLMARAMRGLYPPGLARRTTKGDASADHFGGLRRALPELKSMVDGHLAALGIVDVPRLRRVLDKTAAGLSGDLYPVEAVVSVEAWLRAVAAHPGTTWVPERQGGSM